MCGCSGVYPTGLHVFYGVQKGIKQYPSGCAMEGALEYRIVEHHNELFGLCTTVLTGWITLQVISQTFFFCTSHRLTHIYIYLKNL